MTTTITHKFVRQLEDGRLLYIDGDYPSDAPYQFAGTLTERSPQCFAVDVTHAIERGLPGALDFASCPHGFYNGCPKCEGPIS